MERDVFANARCMRCGHEGPFSQKHSCAPAPMSDYKMVPMVATGELLKAVRDAMPSQLGHGWPTGDDDAHRAYARIIAAAPPFVVTDEVVIAYWNKIRRDKGPYENPEWNDPKWDDLSEFHREQIRRQVRAAIEAVLGGGV